MGAALLLVIGGASAAMADQLVVDGDGVTAVSENAAIVVACTDQPVSFPVLIAAVRKGNPDTKPNNNVFANGSNVTVTFTTGDAGMSASLADPVISLPSDWQAGNTQNDLSDEVLTAIVTLPAKAAEGTGNVRFSYTGTNNATEPVTGTSSVAVTWTTKTCITDTVAPQLTLPGEVVVEATSAAGAAVDFASMVSATDETGPAIVSVDCLPASGSVFSLGTTTVSCSATDAAGNTGAGSFAVVVRDTTDPVVGSMTDIGFEATDEHTIVNWTDPTATDAVTVSPAVTCTPASGTGFAVGDTTVTCSATDTAGNTGSASFTVTISDTTAPSLVVPADLTVEATGPSGAVAEFEASAFDLVDGDVAVDCAPASGALFVLGDTVVECTAADSRGNEASGSFTVHVVDTTKPVVSTPASFEAEATGPSGADVTFSATASDLVDGSLTPVCVPASGSTLPLGMNEVTCTATDAAGNTGSSSFTVTVVDTRPPVLQAPGSITVEATGPDGAIVDFSVIATDIVDGEFEATCDPAPGSTFALGATQVDCSATDAAGNSATVAFPVTVEDNTPPVITWVDGPQHGESYVFGSVPPAGTCTAFDLVDEVVPCEITGYKATVGEVHTLTATASDTSENIAVDTRSYSVTAWTLRGFFQPVDLSGTWNSVKGGATVPLKFEVFAGATELTAVSAVSGFTVKGVACPGASIVTDDIEMTSTGGTSLRYDATAGQFIQNWQTPKKPGSCYQVTMTTQDGSTTTALFKLK
ncbi:hypothetical protein ASD56_13520 [Microbacterium sp. Root166]|uniref:HYR domain-containing protein n=1 Tax=Microbacterium sp. Root166 TaxID=1736478 RepID=UPI0006F6CBAF|nr:HYR domain-containing protein [Microbacterium sp. Root166]KQZ83316.1 hypothetical protein ASD56_13520 [Microbacterium sp. Root166]